MFKGHRALLEELQVGYWTKKFIYVVEIERQCLWTVKQIESSKF